MSIRLDHPELAVLRPFVAFEAVPAAMLLLCPDSRDHDVHNAWWVESDQLFQKEGVEEERLKTYIRISRVHEYVHDVQPVGVYIHVDGVDAERF